MVSIVIGARRHRVDTFPFSRCGGKASKLGLLIKHDPHAKEQELHY
jgi:hypothetical protein